MPCNPTDTIQATSPHSSATATDRRVRGVGRPRSRRGIEHAHAAEQTDIERASRASQIATRSGRSASAGERAAGAASGVTLGAPTENISAPPTG